MELLQNDLDFFIKNICHVIKGVPNPDWRLPVHTNEKHYIIGLCLKGESKYWINDRILEIKEGDVVFIQKGISYSAESDKQNPWEFYSIGFDIGCHNQETENVIGSLENCFKKKSILNIQGVSLCASLYNHWTSRTTGYKLISYSILMEILYRIIICKRYSNLAPIHVRKVEKSVEHIRSNLEKNFSVTELACMVGLSPSYFRMLFKKATGFSVIDYQNTIRINMAKEKIENGESTVGEAARELGFDDMSYFSRLFKKKVGSLPSAHRLNKG